MTSISQIGKLTALMLVATQSLSAIDSPLVAAAPFTITLKSREFDGVRIDSVFIDGTSVSLLTDTLGSWVPVDDERDGFGYLLCHRQFKNVRLGVTEIQSDGLSLDEGAWQTYTENVRIRLGELAVTAGIADSEVSGEAIAIVGWRTRVAAFAVPANSAPGHFEQHTLASNGSNGLLIVLYGPLTEAEGAKNDLQFFLSRLEVR
jgi:hypothetical protein